MQRISIRKTNCTIQWIEIYPVDSVINPLNNWARCEIIYSGGALASCAIKMYQAFVSFPYSQNK